MQRATCSAGIEASAEDGMRRRDIIALIGAAAASPIAAMPAAQAQLRDRMRRVGVLMSYASTYPEGQSYFAAFVQGLRQSGWMRRPKSPH